MDYHGTIEQARAHFDRGNREASAGDFGAAAEAFHAAALAAAPVWRAAAASGEARTLAARLSADASYSAGMAAVRLGDPAERVRAAILLGVEIYERDDIVDDVRLHGLYRAQCAAFELAHALRAEDALQAEEYFRDALGCAEALEALPGAEDEKVARVLANAAAAAHTLATLKRGRGVTAFKGDLRKALELGERAVQMPQLRGMMQAETFLILGDASYDLAMTVSEQTEAAELLRNALGWTREGAEAPGADGILQAQAMLRGANYACVYGLYQRHQDFGEGMAALEGSIELALTVANEPHLPMDLRAPAFETAVRTGQNIGLLLKERDPAQAAGAFFASAQLAEEASAVPGLPAGNRAQCLYLAANARLERAILLQVVAGDEADRAALQALREARDRARAAWSQDACSPELFARAALIACGVAGRLLRTIDVNDTDAVVAELTLIADMGRRAAETADALDEHRVAGANFAADASLRLSKLHADPRRSAELLQRAEALKKLQKVLEGSAG